jgi:hypothetical protein
VTPDAIVEAFWTARPPRERWGDAPPVERNVLLVLELDQQVKNGGFDQYFFNCGENALEALLVLRSLAEPTAGLYERVLSIAAAQMPADIDLKRLRTGTELAIQNERWLAALDRSRSFGASLLDRFVTFRERIRTNEMFSLALKWCSASQVRPTVAKYLLEHRDELGVDLGAVEDRASVGANPPRYLLSAAQRFPHSAERIFAAITDLTFFSRWRWSDSRIVAPDGLRTIGKCFTRHWVHGGEPEQTEFEISVCEEPSRWGWQDVHGPSRNAETLLLETDGDGTRVTLEWSSNTPALGVLEGVLRSKLESRLAELGAALGSIH